jgi:hypothetical protein
MSAENPNNIDFAEAMIEVAIQAIAESKFDHPITWQDLKEALERYIVKEEHNIKKLRDFKLHGK